MAFEIWIAIVQRRDFLEVTVINGTFCEWIDN
jgi:hypothetical protein